LFFFSASSFLLWTKALSSSPASSEQHGPRRRTRALWAAHPLLRLLLPCFSFWFPLSPRGVLACFCRSAWSPACSAPVRAFLRPSLRLFVSAFCREWSLCRACSDCPAPGFVLSVLIFVASLLCCFSALASLGGVCCPLRCPFFVLCPFVLLSASSCFGMASCTVVPLCRRSLCCR
jgi:hypothetical protein